MEQRWRGHWALAAMVRAAVFALPLGASVAAGAIVSRAMPAPVGWAATIFWWLALLAMVTFVLVVVERVARRLLPLAALLRLSLIFPDQAPSRFRIAVRSGGTRKLEQRLKEASEAGLPDAPAEAAEKVLELAALLNLHDRRTRGHSERVRVYADMLADELDLPPADRNRLHWAALLHDIGKLVVPGDILNKPSAPSKAEWEIVRRHPLEGERFIAPLRSWLGDWAAAVGEHHERYDGGGYPRGLAGQEISLAARVVAVADSYEVMTSTRAYKKALPSAEARRELARCAGSQFDPAVVRAFLNISLGRLRLAMGPLAWLAQVPLVSQVPSLGSAASGAVGSAAAGVATSTALVLGGVAEVPPLDLSPAVPVTATGEAVSPTSSVTVAQPSGARTAPPPVNAPPGPAVTTAPTPSAEPAPPPTAAEPGGSEPPAPPQSTTAAPATTAPPTTVAPVPTTAAPPPPVAEPAPPPTKAPRPPNDSEADADNGRGNDNLTSTDRGGSGKDG